jgi:hypothetical protein
MFIEGTNLNCMTRVLRLVANCENIKLDGNSYCSCFDCAIFLMATDPKKFNTHYMRVVEYKNT